MSDSQLGGALPLRPVAQRSRVLLVDEDVVPRQKLGACLREAGYEVHEVASGAEALGRLRQVPIEVVVTHLRLPGLNGIELLARVKDVDPRIEVIILSDSLTVEDTLGALRGRAFDFLQTPLHDPRQLTRAIAEALLQRCLGGRVAAPPPQRATSRTYSDEFSPRERQVLSLLAHGYGNKEIARRLFLGEKTVRNMLTSIYAKLGVVNRTQAVILYQQRGLTASLPLAASQE